jgi:hypothetical protein
MDAMVRETCARSGGWTRINSELDLAIRVEFRILIA